MDVFQQAGETVGQGDAERPQQVVPVWLHVLTGPALGVALAARVLVARSHDVRDEVVVTAGGLEGDRDRVFFLSKEEGMIQQPVAPGVKGVRTDRKRKGGRGRRDESGDYRVMNVGDQ